jgi:hypothetical protein
LRTGKHERGRDFGCIEEDVHFIRTELISYPRGWFLFLQTRLASCPDPSAIPAGARRIDPVPINCRHQEHLKRQIVVHGDAAVDKDELPTIDPDDLRREIDGLGRAGPY